MAIPSFLAFDADTKLPPEPAVRALREKLGLPSYRGSTIVLAGDSRIAAEIEGSDTSNAFRRQQHGAFDWANVFLRHRFAVLASTGVVGNTTAQLLARYDRDVLAYQPQNVLIGIGVNDVTNLVPVADIKANILQMVALNASVGATSILCTVNPRDSHSADQRLALAELNRWFLGLAVRGVIVVDVTSPVVNATAMTWKSGYTIDSDGLHQNRAAAPRMGRLIADRLAPLYPSVNPLPVLPADPLNLIVNPFMDGSGSTATGWQIIGAVTGSLVPSTDLRPGNWQQLVSTAATNTHLRQLNIACPPEWIGRRVKGAIEFVFNAGAQMSSIQLQLNHQSSDGSILMASADMSQNAGDSGALSYQPLVDAGAVVFETTAATVKTGTTMFQFILELSNFVGTVRARRGVLTLAD